MPPMHWKDSDLLSQNSLDKLSKFTKLILHWNARINLTGYRKHEEVQDLLIGESVLAAAALQRSGLIGPDIRVLDFGSGAGIPGLVWAILELPMQLTSLEVRQKKIAFQKEVVRQLDLKCRIVSGRFPEAVGTEEFDMVVSRAIRYDPGIWWAGLQCLTPTGHFVRFATPNAEEPGWQTIPSTERTSLLVKGPSNRT